VVSARTEPTDRSIPPEIMTKVIPTPMIMRYALSMKRLKKFWKAKKPGKAIDPRANMRMKSPRVTKMGKFLWLIKERFIP
jgi:hypothetical protein